MMLLNYIINKINLVIQIFIISNKILKFLKKIKLIFKIKNLKINKIKNYMKMNYYRIKVLENNMILKIKLIPKII